MRAPGASTPEDLPADKALSIDEIKQLSESIRDHLDRAAKNFKIVDGPLGSVALDGPERYWEAFQLGVDLAYGANETTSEQ